MTTDEAPRIGDMVVLPSGKNVMLTTLPYPGCPWAVQQVGDHWEAQRPGLTTLRPNGFAIGRFPAASLDEADARALVELLNAVRPAERQAAGTSRLQKGGRKGGPP